MHAWFIRVNPSSLYPGSSWIHIVYPGCWGILIVYPGCMWILIVYNYILVNLSPWCIVVNPSSISWWILHVHPSEFFWCILVNPSGVSYSILSVYPGEAYTVQLLILLNLSGVAWWILLVYIVGYFWRILLNHITVCPGGSFWSPNITSL